MTDLVESLRARLDERAAKARAAMHGGEGRWQREDVHPGAEPIVDERGEIGVYDEGSPTAEQTAHIIENDPARVLREVEAKRRLLDGHEPDECAVPCCICGRGEDYPC